MRARIWLLLSLLACGITWLYMSRVLLPWEHYIDVDHGSLKAQMGDLYPRWVGTRELLLRGRNPYGTEVSHEIQMAFYGHVIEQKYGVAGVDPIDEQRFVYPVYVVFLLAPTVYMNFSQLQMWAPVIFALLTAISLLLWLDLIRWRPPWALVAATVLFTLGSPQVAQGLRLRQLGLMVAFLLALSAWLIVREHLALAGVILAFSTVKPQMAVLPVVWFLFWGVSAWARRWPLLAGFGVTLAALTGVGELMLPGWPRYFVDGMVAYRKYFPKPSLVSLVAGNTLGIIVSVIAIAGILAFAWRNRNADAASPEFVQTLAAFLICSIFVLPLVFPFNQVLLSLPTMMILRNWPALPRVGRLVFSFVVAWPWVFYLLFLLHPPRLDSPSRLPLLPSALVMIFPFVIFVLFVIGRSRNHELSFPSAASRAAPL